MVISLQRQNIRKRHSYPKNSYSILLEPFEENQIKRRSRQKNRIKLNYKKSITNFKFLRLLECVFFLLIGLFFILFLYAIIKEHNYIEAPDIDISINVTGDIEQILYNTLINKDIREKNEYKPDPNSVKTLALSTHFVKKGESISKIASRYNLRMDTIISYNDIKSAKKIPPGKKLLIPNTNGIKYTVKKGDCLSLIASKFHISFNKLLDWNNITSDLIKPGNVLFIPGAKMNRFVLRKALGTLFIYPAYGKITSSYGRRIHPISGKPHFHNGIDLSNKAGTTIRAALDGKVLKIGYSHVYGKYIILKHDMSFQTLYGHLKKVTVDTGMHITQGKKIGEMGNTGYSTGTHLHFSIYKNGDTVNPLKYLK